MIMNAYLVNIRCLRSDDVHLVAHIRKVAVRSLLLLGDQTIPVMQYQANHSDNDLSMYERLQSVRWITL